MSLRYSSCRSLSSPNIRSISTSEKPMMALSGVRSSWRHVGQELATCAGWRPRAGAVRLLQFLEQARVLDRDHGLVGERLQQRDLLLGERPDLQPPQHDRARWPIALTHERRRQNRSMAERLAAAT